MTYLTSVLTPSYPYIHLTHSKSSAKEATVASQSYDYIIAGGGLAGCALAERLSQDPNKRVLLLEAGTGDYKNKFIRIPAGILRLFKSKFDWQVRGGWG